MGKKSSPPPPDYTAAAEKTAASNAQAVNMQTWANRADQTDPWGSVSWASRAEVDPATGQTVTKWTQNTSLDPRLQQALDSQINIQNQRSQMAEGLLGRVQSEYGQAMDWGNLSPWGSAPSAGNLQAITDPNGYSLQAQDIDTSRMGGYGDYRKQAEDAIYKSATSRLDPQWQQRQQDFDVQMANQGITRGSAAYSKAQDDFNRQRTDAYQQAQMGAITGGGAEAQRNFGMDQGALQQQLAAQQALFGQQQAAGQFGLYGQQQAFGQQQQAGAQNFNQGMSLANFQNQMRQQQLQEAMQQRGFSLNEIQALLNGQQVNMPNFQSYNTAGNAGGTDYSGAAQNQWSATMDAANAQQAGQSGLMSAGATIGSAALMF